MSSGPSPGLYNPAGTASRLRASPLLAIGPAEPGPALRRGFLIAVPIGLCLAVEFGFDSPTKGAIGTGALLAGFAGLDAGALPRAAWQAAVAPALGIAAAVGILSSQSAIAAVLAMGLLGGLAGYLFAYSLRLAIYGLSVSLALMVAQGFFLPADDALPALLWVTLGALTQTAWSLVVWVLAEGRARGEPSGWDARAAAAALRSNLTFSSEACRHGIRFGAALATGVAVYRIFDMEDHGFWIPLTILFVMRPDRDETYLRLVLRAVGTVLGLAVATAFAVTVGGENAITVLVLFAAAGFCFGLLTVQYALFTAAVTTYVVLLTDTLGENAWHAADLRAIGTAVGIAIAFLAWVAWPNPKQGRDLGFEVLKAPPDPPEAPAR
ncbi:MAG: FUSC family protein [Solirubrobacterales bacterium]